MKMSSLLLSLSVLLSIVVPVHAHVPYVPEYDSNRIIPYFIPSTSAVMGKSLAVYDSFQFEGDVDKVAFVLTPEDFDPSLTLPGMVAENGEMVMKDVPLVVTDENGVTGRMLHVGSVVPACAVYNDILPKIAVVGPRQEYLPSYSGTEPLPFFMGKNQGVYLFENTEQGDIWYEEFSFKSYFWQEKRDILLTKPGCYKIYIWNTTSKTGDYVLELGHIEVWGFPEIFRAMTYIFGLIYDAEIHNPQCVKELEELDGPNPTLEEIIEHYGGLFGNGSF